MSTSPSSERNHTASDGRHAVSPLTASRIKAVPNSLILELEQLMQVDSFDVRNVADQFEDAGFSDGDLVLAERVKGNSFSHTCLVRDSLRWKREGLEPYPSIAEKLQSYLFVLDCPRESVPPFLDDITGPDGMNVHALAQLRLNELLLDLSPNAGFPSPSHWPSTAQPPLERLRALANSTIFLQAQSFRSIRHAGEHKSATRRTPFLAAVKVRQDLFGLLVSLHQLGLLATTRRKDFKDEALDGLAKLGSYACDLGQLYKSDDSVWRDGEETKAFYNACGVLTPARPSIEVARLHWNPDYFAYIAARDDIARRNLGLQMRTKLFEALFFTSMVSHNQEQVHYNVDAVIAGLARATIAPDEQAAALWVKAQLRDIGTPMVGVPAALGFLEVLHRYGHRISPADFSVYHQHGADGFTDLAPGWAQAMHIFDITHTMEDVLSKSSIAVDDHATPVIGRRALRTGI